LKYALLITLILHFSSLSAELYPINNEEGKWGYLNDLGELVIAIQYDYAEPFLKDKAIVGNKNKNGICYYGIIDTLNNFIVSMKYGRLIGLSDNIYSYSMKEHSHSGIINLNYNFFTRPKYDDIWPYANGFSIAVLGRNYILINEYGKKIIDLPKEDSEIYLTCMLDTAFCLYSNNVFHAVSLHKSMQRRLNFKGIEYHATISIDSLNNHCNCKEIPNQYKFFDSNTGELFNGNFVVERTQNGYNLYMQGDYTKVGRKLAIDNYIIDNYYWLYQNVDFIHGNQTYFPFIIAGQMVYINNELQFLDPKL
jgi:hypothetical protein